VAEFFTLPLGNRQFPQRGHLDELHLLAWKQNGSMLVRLSFELRLLVNVRESPHYTAGPARSSVGTKIQN